MQVKRKITLMMLLASMASCTTVADSQRGFVIVMNDGQKHEHAISTIKKVYYEGTTMKISLVNGEDVALNVADVKSMGFSNVNTGIEQISNDSNGNDSKVYNLDGTRATESSKGIVVSKKGKKYLVMLK